MKCAVENIRFVGDITGIGLTDRWDVSGTDLGIPVYSPSRQRMYFLFGDTFGLPKELRQSDNRIAAVDSEGARNWRGTVAGYTSDFDLSKGVNWEGFIADEEGNARALIEAHYCKNDEYLEVTKISQGGVEIEGSLYVFYESIRHWGQPGFWNVNYTGVIRSDDAGKTFRRVYDLTWAETDEGEYARNIKLLAEQDMHKQPSGYDLDLSAHVAPGFGQIFALDGKDGYIYIYGRHAGRAHGIKVGRVRKAQFETFAAYEYLTGYVDGQPVWVKGTEGLRILLEKGAECDIIAAPTSNMTISYNSYLSSWILTYFKSGVGIMYSLAETCYGPFSKPECMLPVDYPLLTEDSPSGGNGLYGGFAHELLNAEQGRKLRLLISQWHKKFYNSKLVEITFHRE